MCLFVDDIQYVPANGCIGKINLQVEVLDTTINHDNKTEKKTLLTMLHDEMLLSILGQLSNNDDNYLIVSLSQNF